MTAKVPQLRREHGWLADLLPSVLVDEPSDDFAFRDLVQVFEDVWETILSRAENLPYQIDPRTSSPQMTEWIAGWLGTTPEAILLPASLNGARDDVLGQTAWGLARVHHLRGTVEWYRQMLGFFVCAPGEPLRDPDAISVQENIAARSDQEAAIEVMIKVYRRETSTATPPESVPSDVGALVDRDAVRSFLRRERPAGYPLYLQFAGSERELVL